MMINTNTISDTPTDHNKIKDIRYKIFWLISTHQYTISCLLRIWTSKIHSNNILCYRSIYNYIDSNNLLRIKHNMNMKIINTALLIVVYYLAYLSSATDTLGLQMKDLNAIFPFDVMPPGISFMIAWSLIYVLLGIFTIWLWKKSLDEERYKDILTWMIISHVLHIWWLITNGQQMFIVNVIIIFLLWLVLWKILDILKSKWLSKSNNLWWITFWSYYGWITVATWTLWVSQLVYLANPDFALTSTRSWIAVALSVIMTIFSWFRWKNIYTLILSLWWMWGALWTIFR